MVDWGKLWTRIRIVLWTVFIKIPLGVVYVSIIAEGLRILVPPLGQKLWKLPLLTFLRDYEETHRLDLAPVMSVFILIAVFVLWEQVLEIWLVRQEKGSAWLMDNKAILIVGLGSLVLGADICLFYVGVVQSGWGGVSFSFSALIATAAYLGVLVFVSLQSLTLRLDLNPRLED